MDGVKLFLGPLLVSSLCIIFGLDGKVFIRKEQKILTTIGISQIEAKKQILDHCSSGMRGLLQGTGT